MTQQLTTKTANDLKELKEQISYAISAKNEADTKEERDHFRSMISQCRSSEVSIISFKNELKEIHKSEECACWHTDFLCDYGKLIQEIERVENPKITQEGYVKKKSD